MKKFYDKFDHKAYGLIAKKLSGVVFLTLDLAQLPPLIEFHKIDELNVTLTLFKFVTFKTNRPY